jgi:hypothetical protein
MNYEDLYMRDLPDFSRNYSNFAEAIAVAIQLMESLLSERRYRIENNPRKLRTYLEMRRDLPYVIHKTEIPDTQIVLNRNYKPLGNTGENGHRTTVYEDFKSHHTHIPQARFDKLVNPKDGLISLFGDRNPPWRNRACADAYLGRLKNLVKQLKIRINPSHTQNRKEASHDVA